MLYIIIKMALIYLSNKLINYSGIKFVNAKDNMEKALATYSKFTYEQSLLTLEAGFYIGISSLYLGVYNNINCKKSCNYVNNSGLKLTILLFTLPITTYRTIKYIKSKNQQIIDF